MDETRFEEQDDVLEGTANKKYTFFVIDGSPAMFETAKPGEECEFRVACKLILNEMVRVCCSRSLNNHIGVIISGTKNSDTDGLENSHLLVPIGVLGQDEVNSVRELLDHEDVLSAVTSATGGAHQSDLSNVFNYCKRTFNSFPNTRHQSVIYLTNNRNPFGRDDFWESTYFKRTKSAASKIVGIGQRKTLGEISVILLPEDGFKPENREERNKEPWFHIDCDVFSSECDAAARIRQQITAQRSHANLQVNIGAGVAFDVSVYSMIMEARPLDHSQKYTADTEEKLVKTSGYVTKQKKAEIEAESEEREPVFEKCKQLLENESIRNRRLLKKSITIGGEQIILSSEQYEKMNEIDAKGLDVIGFVPLNRVDREVAVVSPKIIQPNDQTTLGSSRIYRALLDRCWARQQVIVCKYQSRSKQKMRIVALIPFRRDMTLIEQNQRSRDDEEAEKKPDLARLEQERAQADSSEWLHEGFQLIGLPFREELRDDFGKFEEQQSAQNVGNLETMKAFVKRLTMSYNPSFYENPRLLSERAALCLEATGEELIQRRDTLEPYYQIPKRLQRVNTEIEQIIENFEIPAEDGKKAAIPRKRKQKESGAEEPPAKNGAVRSATDKLNGMKKDELFLMASENCDAPKSLKSKTKAVIIEFISDFLEKHPDAKFL